MQTIEVQIINDRLAILNNNQPCLWVNGDRLAWAAYVKRKESEGFTVVWRA